MNLRKHRNPKRYDVPVDTSDPAFNGVYSGRRPKRTKPRPFGTGAVPKTGRAMNGKGGKNKAT